MFNLKRKSFKRFDFTLFITVLLLCIYGIVMIRSATLSLDTNRHVKVQAISTILGFAAVIFLVLLDYQFIYTYLYNFCFIIACSYIFWNWS
jgi:rod shape determining protein RodA